MQVGGLFGISSTWRSPITPRQGCTSALAELTSGSRPLDAA
jgi:hypothetical protein